MSDRVLLLSAVDMDTARLRWRPPKPHPTHHRASRSPASRLTAHGFAVRVRRVPRTGARHRTELVSDRRRRSRLFKNRSAATDL